MLNSDKLEFERGAAAKTEGEDRNNGKENRHHGRHGTTSPTRISSRISPVVDFEQGQVIHLARAKTPDRQRANGDSILNVRWCKTPSTRRREILLPAGIPPRHVRPIRSESRALLVVSIARGRRWLDELLTDATANAESIAKRERCSVRKVNMTISLAFLAPDLVKAAIAGRLPHGMGVARLADLPAEWSRQHQMLGLPSAVG